jgi:hypothetical protein
MEHTFEATGNRRPELQNFVTRIGVFTRRAARTRFGNAMHYAFEGCCDLDAGRRGAVRRRRHASAVES